MSYQKHLSHQQQHSSPAASRLAKLWSSLAASAVVAASLAAIAVSQPATAQLQPLDPDLCATTYRATHAHGPRTEADCRTVVAWRNAVVSNSSSIIRADLHIGAWGTGAQTAFNTWEKLGVYVVDGQRVVTSLQIPDANLEGPLPGELPYIRQLTLDNNLLTGGLPTWIYGASNLSWLDLRNNRLSGTVTGSAFNTPKIRHLLLQHNLFSGQVPDFNFGNLPELVDLRLTNNGFSGSFPSSWDTLATDGRGWLRLQVAENNITGDLPSWVSNLKFANSMTPSWIGVGPSRDYYVDFRDNRLCLPSGFTLPAYKKLDGSNANVQAYFGDNACPTQSPSDSSLPPPADNVQFETVDASGNPTSTNPVGLKVTWEKPSDISGAARYKINLHLTVPGQDNTLQGGVDYRYCLAENFRIPIQGPTSQQQNEFTITSAHNCSNFDPTKYTVSVVTATSTGGTVSQGNSPIRSDWSVYMADDPQKTYRDVAGVLGLDYQRNIWRWDAVNQVWQQRSQLQLDFASLNLEQGSALAMEKRVIPSWLPLAGLSTADADTPVQLQNGWNVISAGGSVERGNEDGAFFIDDTLIDCNSSQGAIAILRNVPGTQRFDIELPCHPSRERAFTRGQAYRTIGEIEELDALFIYFRSVLPVTISWDEDNDRYAPAN